MAERPPQHGPTKKIRKEHAVHHHPHEEAHGGAHHHPWPERRRVGHEMHGAEDVSARPQGHSEAQPEVSEPGPPPSEPRDDFLESDALDAHAHGEGGEPPSDASSPGTVAHGPGRDTDLRD